MTTIDRQTILDGYQPLNVEIDCRRQILTSKVDPRTERVNIFIMAVYP